MGTREHGAIAGGRLSQPDGPVRAWWSLARTPGSRAKAGSVMGWEREREARAAINADAAIGSHRGISCWSHLR